MAPPVRTSLESRYLLSLSVIAIDPIPNAHLTEAPADVIVTFDRPIDPTSLSNSDIELDQVGSDGSLTWLSDATEAPGPGDNQIDLTPGEVLAHRPLPDHPARGLPHRRASTAWGSMAPTRPSGTSGSWPGGRARRRGRPGHPGIHPDLDRGRPRLPDEPRGCESVQDYPARRPFLEARPGGHGPARRRHARLSPVPSSTPRVT